MAELLGEIFGRRVSRNLIMLDALSRPNECQIGRRILLLFALRHDVLALFDQSHHAFAGLGTCAHAEQREALVDALDLLLGLLKMHLE